MKKSLFCLLMLSFACNGMNFSHNGKQYSLVHNELGINFIHTKVNGKKKRKPVSLFQTQLKVQNNGRDRVEFVNAVNRSQDGSKIIMEVEEADAYTGTNANSLRVSSHNPVPSGIDEKTIDAKKILVYDLDTKKTTECPVPNTIDPVSKTLDITQAPSEKERLEDMGYELFACHRGSWNTNHYRNPIQHICVSNDGKKAIVGNRSALFQVDLKTQTTQELIRKKCPMTPCFKGIIIPVFKKIEYSDEDDSVTMIHSDNERDSFLKLSQLNIANQNNNNEEELDDDKATSNPLTEWLPFLDTYFY